MSLFDSPAPLPPSWYPAEGMVLPDFLDTAARENGAGAALHWQAGCTRESPFVTFTYADYRERALACARSLVSLGVPPGGCVSVQSFNCPRYFFVLYGAAYAAASVAGVYTTSSPAQSAYVVDHSESTVAFVEDGVQMRKALQQRAAMPRVRLVVQLSGDPRAELAEAGDDEAERALRDGWVASYDEFEAVGGGVTGASSSSSSSSSSPSSPSGTGDGGDGRAEAVAISVGGASSSSSSSSSRAGSHPAAQRHGPTLPVAADAAAVALLNEELGRRRASLRPDDVAGLIYTSGTTGPPKAVVLTHRNYTFQVVAIQSVYRFGPDDHMVSYLPLSHIAAQMVEVHGPACARSQVWFARPDALRGSLRDTLLAARPTMFFGVPRVWEKFHEAMLSAGAANPAPVRWLAAWAKSVGLAAAYARQDGGPGPWFGALADRLAGAARSALGLDRCRLFYSGAAPIARGTVEYFMSLGVDVHEVYGMSECAGITTISFALPGRHKVGTVGQAEPGTELRVAPDGEVLFRGPHVFRGYLKDEAATREAIDADGWLHSGDLGSVDAHGFLSITGRKKELIITGGGENIPPLVLEAALCSLPAVGQAVAIGDRRKYVTALVTLRASALRASLREAGCSESLDAAGAAADPRFCAYLQEQVDALNRARMPSRAAYVQRVTIIPEEFSVENGVLTATHKIMRRVVYARYANEIEAMYAEPASS